jgi:transposase
LACKTDRIDAWVLAELSRRDLVPAIWLPGFEQRQERERARWRLHLVKHRSQLKHRVHSMLMTFGHSCSVSDLFGTAGRELLARLDFPEPWRSDVLAAAVRCDGPPRPARQERAEVPALGADRGRHARLPAPRLPRPLPGHQTAPGRQRGAKIAQIELARRLAEAIWHMLTRDQPFAPKGAALPLTA